MIAATGVSNLPQMPCTVHSAASYRRFGLVKGMALSLAAKARRNGGCKGQIENASLRPRIFGSAPRYDELLMFRPDKIPNIVQ
jgi:hypothetical protein